MKEEKLPKATHKGTISPNGFEIECYNLDNGQRVLSRIGFLKALGRTGKAKGGRKYDNEFQTPVFLSATNLKPLITEEIIENSQSISFIDLNGTKSIGYKAQLLPEIAYLFAQAYDQGILKPNQIHIGEQAKVLVKGFLQVSIIALVDEATGYQDVRVKDALEKIFNEYLLEQAKKYVVTFPLELYRQWFKLNNWEWKPENAQKRPQILGKWTNEYIYERLAPGLLHELKKRNPKNEKGYREHKYFSFLTDEIGEPRLREFFGGLIALARATSSWRKYIEMVERAYPKFDLQQKIFSPDQIHGNEEQE